MQPFTRITGPLAALPAANIDTDVIMPKQFLKGVDRSGLALGVFHYLRFDAAGAQRPDFILNRAPWRDAAFLAVGPNFGCGSSREHAVWGLLQIGIRAILGTSFAGIFFDNCARNGLLALTLPERAVADLLVRGANPEGSAITVDLEAQHITGICLGLPFEIEVNRRDALLRGLDAVDSTLARAEDIRVFEKLHRTENPWLF